MSATTLTPNLSQDPLANFRRRVQQIRPIVRSGYVCEIVVTTVKAVLPDVTQGELCEIDVSTGGHILGEVIAFKDNMATISCLQSVIGVRLGAKVRSFGRPHSIKAGDHLLGTILDGLGRLMENPADRTAGALSFDMDAKPVYSEAPLAIRRPPVHELMQTGVRVLDGMISIGYGQRLGIFAPPGCGKSTLMAQIVRGANVDAVVFGLVGERGRELREFVEKEIDDNIRQKSIFVVSTSDKSPIERVRASFTATAIAEYLRDQNKRVLLLVDSLTRLARAQREVGLMAGEPSTQSGFTPSVYSIMPELIERSGATEQGSITAIYTVLMEGERLEDDPVASEAKSLLDGHIILTHKLVERAHFPAVDVLKSLSRVMTSVVNPEHVKLAAMARRVYSIYAEVELLIRLNEYENGSDPQVDAAVQVKPKLDAWCAQDRFTPETMDKAMANLRRLLGPFMQVI